MSSQTPSSASPPSPVDGGERRASNCAECGTRPEPGQSFCDGCGAVLNWKSEPASPPARKAPSQPTPPEAGSPSASSPSSSPASARVDPAEADTAPRPTLNSPAGAAASPEIPDMDDTAPTPAASAPPASPSPDEAALRARALLVPVAEPEGRQPEPEVAPVLPGVPAAARPKMQSATVEPADETGPPCPWCSTGNRPDRHFCRRCAMSLADRPGGTPEARRPWWRRIWWAGDRPAPWAGDRPRLRRGISRVFTWIAAGLALSLVVWGLFNVGTAYDAVRDHFAKRAPADPDAYAASRSFKDHDVKNVFDKVSNSWWGPGVSQSAEGEWVEARWAQPTRLLDVLITPGISTRASDLPESAQPRRLEAIITTADGKKTTREITLDRASGAQRRKFRVADVSSVRFVIKTAYNAGPDKQVSIAEIEFFGRSTNNN
ncbi:zinc ribbon domain-containing protein [Streptomyces sp. NPDC093085]|uniref:NADase-type glycan-binding domain-containing protein n=1 Tax=Streptomyces sp. NPDC093085 TaxID=3155068 RepID=UPI00341EB80F